MANAQLSRTQIDRLGERMKKGVPTEVDLVALDDYRRSLGEVYQTVVHAIEERLQLQPTGRPAKTTASIVEKLRRETIRLTQIQDIAGCRLTVSDVVEQDRVVASLQALFPQTTIIDRRAAPSHGYRAVHVVVTIGGKSIEIQVRTALQHLWAELSEKFSDLVDPRIKYDGGPQHIRDLLASFSEAGAQIERAEGELVQFHEFEKTLTGKGDILQQAQDRRVNVERQLAKAKRQVSDYLLRAISFVEKQKERKP